MEDSKKNEDPDEPLDYSQMATFFKYCSDDEKVINGIFREQKIRFTQPAALNDPLEFNPIITFNDNADNYRRFLCDGIVFPSEEERLRSRLVESQMNAFGILSLTKVPDSFNMWSRYANGNKGFLIELKSDFNKQLCMLSKEGEKYPVRQVTYVDGYAINIDELVDEHGWFTHTKANEKFFFTKTSRWEFEKEYRMVRPLSGYPGWEPLSNRFHRDREGVYCFNFSLDCMESVTFGACMSVENKKEIMEACQGTNIKFLQAYIARDQKDRFDWPGAVGLIPIDEFPNFLEMSNFITEAKYIEERKKPPITVRELSDLPYYAHDEQWVRQYYQNRKARMAGKQEL